MVASSAVLNVRVSGTCNTSKVKLNYEAQFNLCSHPNNTEISQLKSSYRIFAAFQVYKQQKETGSVQHS